VACARRREDGAFSSGDDSDRQRDELPSHLAFRYGDLRCSQNSLPGDCHICVDIQCPQDHTSHCGVYCEGWSCPNGSTARHGPTDCRGCVSRDCDPTPATSTASRTRAAAGLELLRLRTAPPVPDVTVGAMVIVARKVPAREAPAMAMVAVAPT
jgi:hypothetical protein